MTGITHLFLGVFFASLPLLYIPAIRDVKGFPSSGRPVWLGLLCSSAIVLCMLFPYHVLPGYIFDLRTIPLMIGILYGGYLSGAMTTLTLYLFRFYLGGDGVWNVLIVYSIITVFLFLLIPTYHEWKPTRKIFVSTGVSLLTSILMLINTNFRVGLPLNEIDTILMYVILHGIVTSMLILCFEIRCWSLTGMAKNMSAKE